MCGTSTIIIRVIDITRFGPNRVAADIQGNGEDDFLVKIELWFRMKLRFRMNLWPKLQYI